MKKSLILIAMAMIVMLCGAAGAGEIPENLLPTDPRLEGLVREALPLEDGMLLLAESEYGNMGWMARVGEDGGVRWVLEEEGGGVFRSARDAGREYSRAHPASAGRVKRVHRHVRLRDIQRGTGPRAQAA